MGFAHELYYDSASADDKTGLPDDYHSFFALYRPLLIASAEYTQIPEQDREDAAQEVAIKFWQKNGLEFFDPERKTKFATLLRKWSGMFMRQERDKTNRAKRNICVDPAEWFTVGEIDLQNGSTVERDVTGDVFASSWVQGAVAALEDAGHTQLVAVLKECVRAAENGTTPSREDVAEAVGCKVYYVTTLYKQLRTELTSLGYGTESLMNV